MTGPTQPGIPAYDPNYIAEQLDRLRDHGFIDDWGRTGRLWTIDCAGLNGPYTRQQVTAWIDGANAMGAG